MATNKIFDEIFSSDNSERAAAFKNNIKSAIASYNTNPSNIAHIRYLNSQYWDMVFFIVKKKLLATGELHFSESEKLAIDFGYISDDLSGENNEITPQALNESITAVCERPAAISCFSISSWLYEQLQDFMGVNKLKEYEKKYEALVALVNNLRDEKIRGYTVEKKLDKSFAANPPKNIARADIDKIISYNDIVDEALEKYGALRSRIQNELLMKKDERVEFVNLENKINKTREERKRFCKALAGLNREYLSNLNFLEDMIIQKEHEIFDTVTMIGKSRQKIEEFIYSKKEILDEEKDDFLKERISTIKNTIEIISKSNKVEPVIFLTQSLHKNIPDILFDIIDKVLEYDPAFFDNKKFKMYSYPDVILVPGKGKGDYDYHMNAFIVPQVPNKDYIDSILNAMAIYRWECDDESKTKNSFSFLKSNKYFTNTSTLMQAFIKNYCLYMSKSITGEDIATISDFDYETRGWFIGYISQREVQQEPSQQDGFDGMDDGAAAADENEAAETPQAQDKKDSFAEERQAPVKEEEPARQNISGELKPERKKSLKLPGEFAAQENQSDEDSAVEGKKPSAPEPAGRPKKILKLPGEFDSIDDGKEETENAGGEIYNKTAASGGKTPNGPGQKENEVSREVNETISLLLKENSAIIKKRINSIFKVEEVVVEPSKDHQKVNITLSNLDVNQVKHFLNLMSLQSKYYKFMSSIIKDEELN